MRRGGRCVDGDEGAEAGADQRDGSRRAAEMAPAVCSSICVVVSVSNAGWLKSGHENPTAVRRQLALEALGLRRGGRRGESVEVDGVQWV